MGDQREVFGGSHSDPRRRASRRRIIWKPLDDASVCSSVGRTLKGDVRLGHSVWAMGKVKERGADGIATALSTTTAIVC